MSICAFFLVFLFLFFLLRGNRIRMMLMAMLAVRTLTLALVITRPAGIVAAHFLDTPCHVFLHFAARDPTTIIPFAVFDDHVTTSFSGL